MYVDNIQAFAGNTRAETSAATMQISRAFAFLCLVVSVGAQGTHRLICYPDVLTPRTREGSCTHLILPSVSSDDDLHLQSLTSDDSYILKITRERNPTLKILLGLEIKTSRLELMSANKTGVENFIQTLFEFLKEKSLDGLDVIWVDANTFDSSIGNTELFPNFLKSLKGVFEEETNPLLLSVSVIEPTNKTATSFDELTLSQYVDFITILPAHLDMDGQYFNTTAQHWRDQQVDLQKLNLALPGFLQKPHHRHHHGHFPKDVEVYEEDKKDYTHVLNSFFGDQVCRAVKSGQEQFITLKTLSDERSPVKEVLQNGFGGIGVVFIDFDAFKNDMCRNMIQKEMAVVELKLFRHTRRSHRRRGHGGLHQHHERGQQNHGHRHHHHGRHHNHGHHHHHHHPH